MLDSSADAILETYELVGRGTSADVFALSQNQVLKLYFANVPRRIIDLEVDASQLAANAGLRVASPLAWQSLGGRTGVVFERAGGELLLRLMSRRPQEAIPSVAMMARYQAHMHQLPIEASLPNLHATLKDKIAGSPLDEAVKATAHRHLAMLEPGHSLCHGDLHPGNAFVAENSLTAIDWSKASIGAPAADAARTELLIRYGQYGRLVQRIPILRLSRHWLAEWYLYFYCRASGVRRSEVAAWRFPVAVAWYRGQATVQASALHSYIARHAARLESRRR